MCGKHWSIYMNLVYCVGTWEYYSNCTVICFTIDYNFSQIQMIHSQFIRSTRIELSAFVRMSAARLIKWYRISQLCQQFCTSSFQHMVSADKCWFSLGFFLMQKCWGADFLMVYIYVLSAVLHISFSACDQRRQVLIFPWLLFWCRSVKVQNPFMMYIVIVIQITWWRTSSYPLLSQVSTTPNVMMITYCNVLHSIA